MSGQPFGDRSFHQVHWLPPPLITDIDRASINFIAPSITKKIGSVNNQLYKQVWQLAVFRWRREENPR